MPAVARAMAAATSVCARRRTSPRRGGVRDAAEAGASLRMRMTLMTRGHEGQTVRGWERAGVGAWSELSEEERCVRSPRDTAAAVGELEAEESGAEEEADEGADERAEAEEEGGVIGEMRASEEASGETAGASAAALMESRSALTSSSMEPPSSSPSEA
jgi:hypothetical protein